ncbi:AsnC family transcriptional regulator [Bacillus wiedmannii]|uniref:Lrp/AsnC family transcriptional regulator n=1 Tax=Bacillus wiedmannii TaxID=1890302 RepID=UPI000BFC921A|nr:Lrp/AsnC family transcriptional regulator [Bacillus wiedmannii]PHE69507.1 AsnC family transcriptional regulator [Bacillus wiedmannii]
MDQTDLKILSHLQENARLSMVEIGKLVGLSSPSVTERVRRLEEQGVIISYRTIVNPKELKKHITAFVLMEPRDCNKYKKFAMEHSDVAECHRIAGMYSYLTKVVTESVHTLEDYINLCLEYGKPTTLIVLSSPVEHKSLFTESEKS